MTKLIIILIILLNTELITIAYKADIPKQKAVKEAFEHAWEGYKKCGWGRDNMHTVTCSGYDWLQMGLTIVDAIDTLVVMNETDYYNEARNYIANYDFNPDTEVSLFDVTMRVIGGLLGAHSLTGDDMFLQKAATLEKTLLPAYCTPSGIPYDKINPKTGSIRKTPNCIAGAGTCLMELTYLSEHTGDPIFQKVAQGVVDAIKGAPNPSSIPGLFPVDVDPETGSFIGNRITIGAAGDSFYEYLVKLWVLLGGGNDVAKQSRKDYDLAMDGVMSKLLFTSVPRGLLFTADLNDNVVDRAMGHLACFSAGMFALGAKAFNTSSTSGNYRSDDHFKVAEELARTCYMMYKSTDTRIGPEVMRFPENGPDFEITEPGYYLRPETVESFFYLWRYTHDQMYRDWAWNAFQAITKTCYAEYGFTDIGNVTNSANPDPLDNQDPYFLAETFKYLYLIFSDDELVPLDQFVFTTEAHPLKIIFNSTH